MYLEAFVDPTDAKGRLYIYDKKLGVIQPSSTKDAGLEKHYYSFHTETGERDSDTVEDALQRVEDAAAPAMRALRAGKVLDADISRSDRMKIFGGNLRRITASIFCKKGMKIEP